MLESNPGLFFLFLIGGGACLFLVLFSLFPPKEAAKPPLPEEPPILPVAEVIARAAKPIGFMYKGELVKFVAPDAVPEDGLSAYALSRNEHGSSFQSLLNVTGEVKKRIVFPEPVIHSMIPLVYRHADSQLPAVKPSEKFSISKSFVNSPMRERVESYSPSFAMLTKEAYSLTDQGLVCHKALVTLDVFTYFIYPDDYKTSEDDMYHWARYTAGWLNIAALKAEGLVYENMDIQRDEQEFVVGRVTEIGRTSSAPAVIATEVIAPLKFLGQEQLKQIQELFEDDEDVHLRTFFSHGMYHVLMQGAKHLVVLSDQEFALQLAMDDINVSIPQEDNTIINALLNGALSPANPQGAFDLSRQIHWFST